MTAFKLLWFLEHLNKTEPSIILLVTPLLLPQSACCDKGLCRSMDHSRCFFFQHFPKFLLLLISADMWQTPLWHRHLLNVVLPQIDSRAGEEALFIDPILREPIMIMCVVPSTHRCNVWFPWEGGRRCELLWTCDGRFSFRMFMLGMFGFSLEGGKCSKRGDITFILDVLWTDFNMRRWTRWWWTDCVSIFVSVLLLDVFERDLRMISSCVCLCL